MSWKSEAAPCGEGYENLPQEYQYVRRDSTHLAPWWSGAAELVGREGRFVSRGRPGGAQRVCDETRRELYF